MLEISIANITAPMSVPDVKTWSLNRAGGSRPAPAR